jgi:hypothetical protein
MRSVTVSFDFCLAMDEQMVDLGLGTKDTDRCHVSPISAEGFSAWEVWAIENRLVFARFSYYGLQTVDSNVRGRCGAMILSFQVRRLLYVAS